MSVLKNDKLVERLEAEAVKEMYCGFDTVHSLLLREAAAALRATTGEETYEFEVWQDEMPVASGGSKSLDDARREAEHYAVMYGTEGPVEIRLFARLELGSPAAAPPPPLRDAGAVALTVATQALEEAEDMLSDARMKLSAFKPTARPAPAQVDAEAAENFRKGWQARDAAPQQPDEAAVERLVEHLRDKMFYRSMAPATLVMVAREYLAAAAQEGK